MFGNPTSDTFAKWDLEVVDDVGMGVFGSAQDQHIAFKDVDETGVAAYEFGNNLHNFVQDIVQGIGGRNATAHGMKEFKRRNRFSRVHVFHANED